MANTSTIWVSPSANRPIRAIHTSRPSAWVVSAATRGIETSVRTRATSMPRTSPADAPSSPSPITTNTTGKASRATPSTTNETPTKPNRPRPTSAPRFHANSTSTAAPRANHPAERRNGFLESIAAAHSSRPAAGAISRLWPRGKRSCSAANISVPPERALTGPITASSAAISRPSEPKAGGSSMRPISEENAKFRPAAATRPVPKTSVPTRSLFDADRPRPNATPSPCPGGAPPSSAASRLARERRHYSGSQPIKPPPKGGVSAGGPAGLLGLGREVGVDHLGDQLFEVDPGLPAQDASGLRRVGHQLLDVGGTEEPLVGADETLPVLDPSAPEGQLDHLADRVRDAAPDHVVVGLGLLEHEPHGADVVAGEPPVPLRVEVPQGDLALQPELDPGDPVGDLPRDELQTATSTFVVKQDPAHGVQVVRLPVVDRGVVAEDLRHAVRAAWMERGHLVLRRLTDPAEHLAGGR